MSVLKTCIYTNVYLCFVKTITNGIIGKIVTSLDSTYKDGLLYVKVDLVIQSNLKVNADNNNEPVSRFGDLHLFR